MAGSSRRGFKARIVAGLVWFHRWLGVATCLIIAAWFASGAVLLFQPFPSLGRQDAAAIAAPIALADVRISPAEALALAGPKTSALRLVQRADIPVYLAGTPGTPLVIDARSGERLKPLSPQKAAAIMRDRGYDVASVTGPFAYDQWVVHNKFDPLRPFYRIAIGDQAGSEFYVSAVTGEIVQRTRFRERAWNWAGAVLHWAYLTPLRSHFAVWDQSVWWLSFVAMLVVVAGIILGLLRTVTVRRAGRPGLTYFRPFWLRWHHLLGLFAGLFILGWTLSGWLSMDHGRLFSHGQASAMELRHYEGLSLERAASSIPAKVVAGLPSAKAVTFGSIGGTPVLLITGADGDTIPSTRSGQPIPDSERGRLIRSGLQAAWPAQPIGPPSPIPTDDLYALAENMPATTVRYPLGSRSIYVDRSSGAIVTVMDASRASYAWVYYALHTFNFPGLIGRPVLRKIIILALLAAGFAFSLTSMVLGYRRLRRLR